jgi:hypothetical protein
VREWRTGGGGSAGSDMGRRSTGRTGPARAGAFALDPDVLDFAPPLRPEMETA